MSATVLSFPSSRSRRPTGAGRHTGEATLVDLAAYREMIARGADRWEIRAAAVVDALEELLASRNGLEVAEFCERAVQLLEDNAAAIHDDPAVRRLAARLGAVRERALRVSR